jgi:hypothetical protein
VAAGVPSRMSKVRHMTVKTKFMDANDDDTRFVASRADRQQETS